MRLVLALVSITVVALAAGAVPALPSDSGSVVGTVDVAPPPAPCVTTSTNAVSFGTQPLSDPAAASTPFIDATPLFVTVASCATAGEDLLLSATDATTATGGKWHVPDFGNANTCTDGLNQYQPYANTFNNGSGRLYTSAATRFSFDAAESDRMTFQIQIQMPCRGSVGAGETVSMTFPILAVLK